MEFQTTSVRLNPSSAVASLKRHCIDSYVQGSAYRPQEAVAVAAQAIRPAASQVVLGQEPEARCDTLLA